MISTSTVFLALVLSVATHVQALNDWSVPCNSGQCSFDVARTANTLPASINIWGKSSAISDLTNAGGWMIMGCDGNALTQQVRVVCKSTDAQSAGCDHITEDGADGTVVRLPPGCGKGPFAVVQGWTTAEDQTIDPDTAKKIDTTHKRGVPTVYQLTIDSKFSNYGSAPHGDVNFALAGGSIEDPTTITPSNARRSRDLVTQRDLQAKRLLSFNKSKTLNLPPVNLSKSFSLASSNISCAGPIGPIGLSVGADVAAHANVAVTIAASGKILPPKITTFGISSNVNGSIASSVTFAASASGAPLDITQQLFSVGIPGFDIPGIFQLGPTFNVDGRVTLALAAEVDVKVGVNYDFNNVAFTFPANNAAPPTGSPTPQDSNLDLSVSPNITVQGSLSAHLIPQISFGLKAFEGLAQATLNFGIDTSATAAVNASAGVVVSTAVPTRRDASAGINACVDISGGINGELSADADFFSLFNKGASLSVFSKNFQLFSKCVGLNTSHSKRALSSVARAPTLDARASSTSLTCPPSAVSSAQSVVSGVTIPASSIKAVS